MNRKTILMGATALLVATAGLAFGPSAAWAMDADAADATADATLQLDEIIVQARRVDENLQRVPVAVTAFSGDDLAKQNFQKVQDLAKFTPGLSINPASSTPTAVTITLRGQVQTDILVTLDPSVGTYVDGVYWARAYGLNSDLLDVSSVQVLKGPQGTLFGRNTTGGALLINSNDPNASEASGRISATYGRYNERQMVAVANLPLVTDKLALRVAASVLKRNGYMTNSVPATSVTGLKATTAAAELFTGSPNGLKYDNRDRWNGRAKLLFNATDNLSIVLSAERSEQDERSPGREIRLATPTFVGANTTYNTASTASLFTSIVSGNSPAAGPGPGLAILTAQAAALAADKHRISNNEVPYAVANADTFNATVSLRSAIGDFKLIASDRTIKTHAGVDLDGSSFAIHFTEGRQEIEQKSVELQLTGKTFDDKLDYAMGAFAFKESGFDQSLSVVVPALSASISHFYGLIHNKSVGAYGQGTYHLNDKLSFTGGLRYSKDRKGLDSRNNNYNSTTGLTTCSLVNPTTAFSAGATEIINVPGCSVRRSDSFDGVSYTAGPEYQATEQIMVYVKTAKGFRSGGQNLRAPSTAFFIPFKPEIAYSYEAGLKSELFDRRLRLNISAYTSTINDLQRSTLIANPLGGGLTATILSNAGKARINGAEVEAQALLFTGFKVTATGALTDPKYIRFADLTGDRSFETFGGVAKRQFSLAADYTTEIAGSTVAAHVDYSWRSKLPGYFYAPNPGNAALSNATTAPSQGLIGARVSATLGERYEVALFGRNLGNNRSFVNNLLVAPVGYVSSVRYEPATYGVTATARF